MTGALQVGPFTLPWQLLAVLVAIAVSSFVGHRLGRRAGIDVDPQLFRTLLVAVVVARLAFVILFFDAYRSSPLGILDIRDGGWRPLPGLFAAWLYALWLGLRSRPMRLAVWGALGSATLVWSAASLALFLTATANTPLPSISLNALDGRQVSLQQFQGKPTVVNLWATWCPPCRREMPVLAQAQATHADVNFVFLNQGEAAEKVGDFLSKEKLALHNVLLDRQGEASGRFGQRALPTTLFFDATGHLVDTRIGEVSLATLTERLQAIRVTPSSTPTSLLEP
ncbi:TlpA disulfide reductase family protein [Variovorax sp. RTB1]|uniref:TlpA disulfide reductase family protein n=1 Tax=Variovorax sp. RTB1 TaxID=3048631 RepID=UPI0019B0F04E|nr:TlpA disulfide reductase family protein [Variovorax sp. RTB1]MBC7704868.1 TlpA family protein disulfide reductase [Rhodoferax sp.]MEB0114111.1 TlpA disulfide reductase family protein [Variovorax sp. RTB1]